MVTNNPDKLVKRVAILGGSGGKFIQQQSLKMQMFILLVIYIITLRKIC